MDALAMMTLISQKKIFIEQKAGNDFLLKENRTFLKSASLLNASDLFNRYRRLHYDR